MITTVLIGLVIVVAAILVIAAFQPSTFRVTRSITMQARPAVPFAHVNELTKWQAWSPWEKVDPALRRTYEGPPAGVGAIYAWEGNNAVGSGRMTIVSSRPGESIRFKLEFFKPMAGLCEAEFTFAPAATGTTVTWVMTGASKYISKIFCLFMNMDKMIGGQFEQGLANLKSVAEASTVK